MIMQVSISNLGVVFPWVVRQLTLFALSVLFVYGGLDA